MRGGGCGWKPEKEVYWQTHAKNPEDKTPYAGLRCQIWQALRTAAVFNKRYLRERRFSGSEYKQSPMNGQCSHLLSSSHSQRRSGSIVSSTRWHSRLNFQAWALFRRLMATIFHARRHKDVYILKEFYDSRRIVVELRKALLSRKK